MQPILKKTALSVFFVSILLGLSACGTEDGAQVFIKADPAAGAELDHSPRTLRIYLTELPDIGNSSISLAGPEGDVPLSRFHTMGANDLMVEVDQNPLPNGQYTVEWTARFVDGDKTYAGSYQFSVSVPD